MAADGSFATMLIKLFARVYSRQSQLRGGRDILRAPFQYRLNRILNFSRAGDERSSDLFW